MDSRRKEFTFYWLIENYSYCLQMNGESLCSPSFYTVGLEETSWNLRVYPRGREVLDKGHVSLYLHRVDDQPKVVSIKFQLSALASDRSAFKCVMGDSAFAKNSFGFGADCFLEMDEILLQREAYCLPQDTLTLRCKIWQGNGNDVHNLGQCSARTRIKTEKISFLHVVENFSMADLYIGHNVRVPFNSQKECFVSCRLFRTYAGEVKVQTEAAYRHLILCRQKISLLEESGNVVGCGENDNRCDVDRKDISVLTLSLTRQEINDYFSNRKLSFLCECDFSTGPEINRIEVTQQGDCKTSIPMQIAYNKKCVNTTVNASAFPGVLEDIKNLYVNQWLTDVQLKTKTKSFPAHKSVLCARSPVFQAMMTSDMKERNDSCIQVSDLEDDVVQKFLFFMYSDVVENIDWNLATRLFYAGDKYQVGRLREVCSSFLLENLTPSNASELLLLADTHGDTNFKKSVEDFIMDHEEVFVSEEWEGLMETRPALALKTMHLKFKRRKK